jgi:hypothetical protein
MGTVIGLKLYGSACSVMVKRPVSFGEQVMEKCSERRFVVQIIFLARNRIFTG